MTVAAEPQQPKGFLEWCRDAAAPDEVRYTVTVLIAYLENDDCATAARSLATEDRLDLENYAVTREFGLDEYRPPPPTFAQMIAERPVRDLRPISGMTNLRVLNPPSTFTSPSPKSPWRRSTASLSLLYGPMRDCRKAEEVV